MDIETQTDGTATMSHSTSVGSNDNVQSVQSVVTPSQERLLDADEIEKVATQLIRPTARMQLEAFAKKLRKEGEALKRVEKCQDDPLQQQEQELRMDIDLGGNDADNNNTKQMESNNNNNSQIIKSTVVPTTVVDTSIPVVMVTGSGGLGMGGGSTVKYIPIDRFAFDAGGYNAPFVTVYVTLPDVGTIPREQITCDFQVSSFDLIIKDLHKKSYRLYQDHLEKDIHPMMSKLIIKSDKIIIKLAKVKQKDYGGYDYWTKLSDKKSREKDNKLKDNPQASIMDMMKQMYEDGDDNMKKIIGETMMKQQRGELGKDNDPMKGFDDMGI